MTYNVFGGTLNVAKSQSYFDPGSVTERASDAQCTTPRIWPHGFYCKAAHTEV